MILKSLFQIFLAANVVLLAICAYSFSPDFRSQHPAAPSVAALGQ